MTSPTVWIVFEKRWFRPAEALAVFVSVAEALDFIDRISQRHEWRSFQVKPVVMGPTP